MKLGEWNGVSSEKLEKQFEACNLSEILESHVRSRVQKFPA